MPPAAGPDAGAGGASLSVHSQRSHTKTNAPHRQRARRAGALGPQYGTFRAPGYMQQKIDMVKTRGAESMVIV